MLDDKSDENKAESAENSVWLAGRLLIAMPTMADERFSHAVIYVCSHTPNGAMGLIINRLYGQMNFRGLLDQLSIEMSVQAHDLPVHFGGPVEPGRGFILHSSDYQREGTMPIDERVSLTATIEILEQLAEGEGPDKSLLALGYAGWGAGQLEAELQTNGWLVAPADDEILFGTAMENKWDRAMAKIGVNATMLSGEIGHA